MWKLRRQFRKVCVYGLGARYCNDIMIKLIQYTRILSLVRIIFVAWMESLYYLVTEAMWYSKMNGECKLSVKMVTINFILINSATQITSDMNKNYKIINTEQFRLNENRYWRFCDENEMILVSIWLYIIMRAFGNCGNWNCVYRISEQHRWCQRK